MLSKFKGSAIHNICVNAVSDSDEGLIIPIDILERTDIHQGQEVIITKIGGGNWKNRIRTFVLPGKTNGEVVACGSLAKFFTAGDLTCLISEFYFTDLQLQDWHKGLFPVFDLGFNPETNKDNRVATLDLQYFEGTRKNVVSDVDIETAKRARNSILRIYASSLILGLCVNKTHPDCLQGSAELPKSVMDSAAIERYKAVSVYNSSLGGVADTYAVPMPEGIVMTTGAMASFAAIGQSVNIVSYIMGYTTSELKTTHTNGTEVTNENIPS